MKLITNTTILFWIFLSSAFAAFALETPTNISATDVTDTSISLWWDEVQEAAGYHVYFSENPSVEILTAQKREFNTVIPLVLTDLNPGTQYYFILNGYDEVWEDGPFSQEVSFTTLWEKNNTESEDEGSFNSAMDFKLSSIEVLAQNQISLLFTSALENAQDSERIFKVVDKNDEFIQYAVSKSEIDDENENKVIVTFDELLPVDTEFKLTVISILDNQGRNLESGIESFENFIIETEKLNYVYQEDTDTIVIINDDNTSTPVSSQENSNNNNSSSGGDYIDLTNNSTNSGTNNWSNNSTDSEWSLNGSEDDTWNTDTWVLNEWNNTATWVNEATVGDLNAASEVSWNNMNSEEVWVDIVSAWKDANTLPTTWPEHIFMLILALVFGTLAFVFKFKQS